jgi:hypothetical protein
LGSDTEEKMLFRTNFGPKFSLVSFTPSVFKYCDIKILLYFQIYDTSGRHNWPAGKTGLQLEKKTGEQEN